MEQHIEFPKYTGIEKQLMKMFRILPFLQNTETKKLYIFLYTHNCM